MLGVVILVSLFVVAAIVGSALGRGGTGASIRMPSGRLPTSKKPAARTGAAAAEDAAGSIDPFNEADASGKPRYREIVDNSVDEDDGDDEWNDVDSQGNSNDLVADDWEDVLADD